MPMLGTLTEAPHNVLISGAVELTSTVILATGTILKADPGSRLILMDGVCLGSNTIIHARWGDLLIEHGATVGGDGLIVGHGRVGAASCVGGGSTLLNPQIEPYQVVPAKSYVAGAVPGGPVYGYGPASKASPPSLAEPDAVPPQLSGSHPEPSMEGTVSPGNAGDHALPSPTSNGHGPALGHSHIYGRDQVNQLLNTLFPHRQSLNRTAGENNP